MSKTNDDWKTMMKNIRTQVSVNLMLSKELFDALAKTAEDERYCNVSEYIVEVLHRTAGIISERSLELLEEWYYDERN